MQVKTPKAAATSLEDTRQCANCNAPVTGPFCQTCGQRHDSHLHPFRQLVRDALSTVLNLDGRFYQTVQLMFKPGRLTKAYLDGQRARFVPPFRLYLSFSIVYFALAAWLNIKDFLLFNLNFPPELSHLPEAFPRFLFVLVPAFALLLKGLYRKRLYAEHLIFSLHFHAVLFVVFSLTALLEYATSLVPNADTNLLVTIVQGIIDVVSQLGVLIYLFMAMRYVYKSSRFKTLIKIFLLLMGYVTLLILVILGYVYVTKGPAYFHEMVG